MNGEWIWILLALFGIFRLLLLAGKKKEGQVPPASPGPDRAKPPPPREEVDDLKRFIDSLTRSRKDRPEIAPPPWNSQDIFSASEEAPPPPVSRPRRAPRPRPRPPAPVPASPEAFRPPAARPSGPVRPVPGLFSADLPPVVRGVIFSEILGPPRGLGGGSRLPSDLDSL